MKKLVLMCLVLSLTACVHSPKKSEITQLDDGVYQISAIVEEKWSGDFVQADLLVEAEQFCAKDGLTFQREKVKKEDERRFNYANAVIEFKCVR